MNLQQSKKEKATKHMNTLKVWNQHQIMKQMMTKSITCWRKYNPHPTNHWWKISTTTAKEINISKKNCTTFIHFFFLWQPNTIHWQQFIQTSILPITNCYKHQKHSRIAERFMQNYHSMKLNWIPTKMSMIEWADIKNHSPSLTIIEISELVHLETYQEEHHCQLTRTSDLIKQKKIQWYRQYRIRKMELDLSKRKGRNPYNIYICM